MFFRIIDTKNQQNYRAKADFIRATVCLRCGITPLEMDGPRRPDRIAHPRMLAMYLVRELTPFTLQEIGDMFGGRDHGTVIWACNKTKAALEVDPDLRALVAEISNPEDKNQLKLAL